jgi:hypothetical protein
LFFGAAIRISAQARIGLLAPGIDLASEYANCKNLPYDFGFTRLRGAMTDDPSTVDVAVSATELKPLTPAAQRALAEAEARRRAAEAASKSLPKELQGPKGPEPTRYGDWENKGIASDF